MQGVKVGAFTGGRDVPSARFRVRQHIPILRKAGVDVDELPYRFGKYPPVRKPLRPIWGAAVLVEQLCNTARLGRYDAVLLQREAISKMYTVERFIRKPIALDVDDAIYCFNGGRPAQQLAEIADVVICGNATLAQRFSEWSKAVRVIPTAVDTVRFAPRSDMSQFLEPIIGWTGTSGNLCELEGIEAAIAVVLHRFPGAKLRVLCDRPPRLTTLRSEQIVYTRWTAEAEVGFLQGLDVGVMPLRDSEWTRGKCAFKLLQYMATGVSSVVSDVGMNAEIARSHGCTLAVSSTDEWVDGLTYLLADEGARRAMGLIARRVATEYFSVRVIAPQLADAIKSVV